MLARFPWHDDARVRAALDDLVAHVQNTDLIQGQQCIAHASTALEALLGPLIIGDGYRGFESAWRESMALLDAVAPAFDAFHRSDADKLRKNRAMGLGLASPDAAIQELGVLAARDDDVGEWARGEIEWHQRDPDRFADRCGSDDL
jgi:hypothetical protein